MLEFYENDKFTGYVSIYTSYLLLNKSLINCFNDAYRVRLACDKEKNEIYLFKLDKDEALSGVYPESSLLKLHITKTYGRISQRSVIEFIEKTFALNIPKDGFIKYNGKYYEDKKLIIIKIEEGL